MQKIILFCFPYAGGSAAIFHQWKQYLDPQIELRPIELAGRGRRIHDPLYKDRNSAVDDAFDTIRKDIIQFPYALFGHSMGCRISYELAQKIGTHNLPSPLHVFFSGCGAPHVKRADEKVFHLMNDNDFKNEVLKLGGTPSEFFEHPELLELFLPLLKNDFKIAEEKRNNNEIQPFDFNCTVFLGKDDDLNSDECHGWRLHTKGTCSTHYFNGGHFFLHDEAQKLAKCINSTLRENLLMKLNSLALTER